MIAPWTGPVLLETDLAGLGPKRKGKVRDNYDLGEALLLVATDRISAFDVILPEGIPGKGYVLTQLSRFWFDRFGKQEGIVSHHLLSTDVKEFPAACKPYQDVLSGRTMLVRKAKPLPVECIVRGYLAGSGWKEYRESGKVCGVALPGGLRESERLPEPIFTPTTKATIGHDMNISFDQMKLVVGEELAEEARAVSLRLYGLAAGFAEKRGIIIADTKMEFGLDVLTGKLMLIDEVFTPDSSRFWPMDGYAPGRSQPSFDKQYVRDYLDKIGWNRQPPPPHLPPVVVEKTAQKYRDALERFTGQENK
jgi:phosphoribosylaminoimidazole-succinocarboxamide synthase